MEKPKPQAELIIVHITIRYRYNSSVLTTKPKKIQAKAEDNPLQFHRPTMFPGVTFFLKLYYSYPHLKDKSANI